MLETFSMSNIFPYQTFQYVKVKRCWKNRTPSYFRGKRIDNNKLSLIKREEQAGDWKERGITKQKIGYYTVEPEIMLFLCPFIINICSK